MIYKMNNKEIRKLLIDFSSTSYGRTIFLLSYSMLFILFISLIITICTNIIYKSFLSSFFIIVIAFITLLSFIIGSLVYYKELRIYASNR